MPVINSDSRVLEPNGKKSILVVGPSWVGDLVMSQVLFKVLAQQNPGVRIDVLAPGFCAPLLERMPEVGQALTLSVGHGELAIAKRYQLGMQLRAQAYDQAILLPNSFKSAFIPWFANIAQRTGWRGEMRYGLLNDMRYLDKVSLPLMIQRFAALGYSKGDEANVLDADALPKPALQTNSDYQAKVLSKLNLNLHQPVLAICPGAEFGEAKRWPPKYYAKVANHWIQAGWQVWAIGSAKDAIVISEIEADIADSAAFFALAGKTNLSEAVDLLASAKAIVTNDSGLMHIAAALSKPLVAVYGSTSPSFTPPLCDRAEPVFLEMPCRPCFERVCPLGHTNCLNELMPERVVACLQGLVDQPRSA